MKICYAFEPRYMQIESYVKVSRENDYEEK